MAWCMSYRVLVQMRSSMSQTQATASMLPLASVPRSAVWARQVTRETWPCMAASYLSSGKESTCEGRGGQ